LFHHGSRGEEIGERRGNGLVGNNHLAFESIQLRLMEHFPPLATNHVVLWLGGFPAVSFFELLRGQFFESGRRLDGRFRIFWREAASGEQNHAPHCYYGRSGFRFEQ
jgi:hypothetical protein